MQAPDKVRAGALGVEPLLCALRYVHAAALNSSPARFTFHVLKKVIVEIESAILRDPNCALIVCCPELRSR
jgi:hypothetical protein